mgnify:CR=1 FL=1
MDQIDNWRLHVLLCMCLVSFLMCCISLCMSMESSRRLDARTEYIEAIKQILDEGSEGQ